VHFCVPDIDSQTTSAHFISAGSALKLGDALVSGEIKNGFALVRPPGHHAMRVVHGNRGFCNINNEAILVEYLRSKYGFRKIAIVDTDVHHGDGTQDVFYHDPDVLFISVHQDGRTLYPGSGFVDEVGGPGAHLRNINIPLPPGTTDEGFLSVLRQIIKPALEAFQPELIINSAGQDNHFTDPLANMKVTAQGYGKLTEELRPDLAVLEGGYAIETALPYVNLSILLALAAEDYSMVVEPQYRPDELRQSVAIDKHIAEIISYWQEKLAQNPPDKESLFGPSHISNNRRNIYYDTDHISEEQQESVDYCPDCPGLYRVISEAKKAYGRDYTLWGISIPLFACTSCHKRAYELWDEQMQKKAGANGTHRRLETRYDFYCLQDKKEDRYLKENR